MTKLKTKDTTKKSNGIKPVVSRSKNGGKLKDFHIATLDGTSELNFFTKAVDSKKALKNLLTNSWDFKNLAKKYNDMTITIKALK